MWTDRRTHSYADEGIVEGMARGREKRGEEKEDEKKEKSSDEREREREAKRTTDSELFIAPFLSLLSFSSSPLFFFELSSLCLG